MSIATLNKRLDSIEFVIAEQDDPANLRLFAAFVGLYESGCGHIETYYDLESGTCYGPEHLDTLQADGFEILVLFDPSRCDHAKLGACGFYSTPEGTPERAAEERLQAAVFPEIKEENIYLWRDCRPGQFLAQIERSREQLQA